MRDEAGNTYYAQSTDFNESVGPASLTYTDSTGTEKTIQLYGNQMTHVSDNKVTATLKINQNQTLNIANVPVGTTYSITESDETGYSLVRIEKEISNAQLELHLL